MKILMFVSKCTKMMSKMHEMFVPCFCTCNMLFVVFLQCKMSQIIQNNRVILVCTNEEMTKIPFVTEKCSIKNKKIVKYVMVLLFKEH